MVLLLVDFRPSSDWDQTGLAGGRSPARRAPAGFASKSRHWRSDACLKSVAGADTLRLYVRPLFSATMSFKKFVMAGALGCAAASASAFVSMPAQAACLTATAGTAPNIDNNCLTYDTTSSPTKAILRYSDVNLATDTFSQITLNTSVLGNFSDWEYGSNGTSWTSFSPGFTVAPNTGGLGQISSIVNATPGNPYFLRVTLSNTATLDTSYSFTFLTNATGSTDANGQLVTGFGSGSSNSRSFTRVADPVTTGTPGPLPLMGAAAAFGYSRKIRKAIRAVG